MRGAGLSVQLRAAEAQLTLSLRSQHPWPQVLVSSHSVHLMAFKSLRDTDSNSINETENALVVADAAVSTHKEQTKAIGEVINRLSRGHA